MKTITVNLYSFDELSEQSKRVAINNYDTDYDINQIYEESYESYKAFCEIFGLTEYICDDKFYLNINNLEDNILELKGIRLAKWLWNNHKHNLFSGKYYGYSSYHNGRIKHNRVNTKILSDGKFFNAYKSAITLSNDSVLTGLFYDDILLKPIYDFLNYDSKYFNEDQTLDTLLLDCLGNLNKTVLTEVSSIYSKEHISEYYRENNIEFYKNGEQYV